MRMVGGIPYLNDGDRVGNRIALAWRQEKEFELIGRVATNGLSLLTLRELAAVATF